MRHTLQITSAVFLALWAGAPDVPARAEEGAKAPAGTLRLISDFRSPPFAYREGMKRVGVEVDIAEAIAKEIGRKIEWIPMNFSISAYASALNLGKADAAISSISITDERAELVSFTKPYARMGLSLAVRSTIDWRRSWFSTGLKRWKICVMRGTTAELWARKNLTGKVQYYSSLDRMVSVLKSSPMPDEAGSGGTCILYDEVPLRWRLSSYSYHYQIVESGISPQEYGIAVRKGDTALLESLNAAIARLRTSEEGRRLREKWHEKAEGLSFFEDYGE